MDSKRITRVGTSMVRKGLMRLKKDALTKVNRDTMLKGHVDAMLKPLTKVKRVPIDLTHC